MYDLYIKPEVDKIFGKLSKKDSKQLMIIHKKIDEIRANPAHSYKFLRKPLAGFNRVHTDSHFVLIFRMDHEKKIVDVYHYSHHDDVYKWRPEA